VSEFHAKAPHATVRVKDLPQIHTWRLDLEATTLRTKGEESTNESPRPTHVYITALERVPIRWTAIDLSSTLANRLVPGACSWCRAFHSRV